MKPPTLSRKTLLLLCGAACILACEASAQSALPPTGGADEDCTLATPYTVACVEKYMITNDQLQSAVSAHSLANSLETLHKQMGDTPEFDGARRRLADIMQSAKDEAVEMGIATPDMYVSMLTTQAAQTREGKDFVLVNEKELNLSLNTDIGADRLKVSLGRELAHIRNGDTAPSAVAHYRNDAASSREAELRAELEGSGPLGGFRPLSAIDYAKDRLRDELQKLVFFKGSTLNDIDPNRLSDRDYKAISDEHEARYGNPFHLSPWERIVALRRELDLMLQYGLSHEVRTHSDREAESKWLVDQILHDSLASR